jgi:small multidrug resistance pump
MDLGAAYAIWSAVGLSVISVVGVVVFRESLSPVQVVGLGLVVVGITALQLGGTHG